MNRTRPGTGLNKVLVSRRIEAADAIIQRTAKGLLEVTVWSRVWQAVSEPGGDVGAVSAAVDAAKRLLPGEVKSATLSRASAQRCIEAIFTETAQSMA